MGVSGRTALVATVAVMATAATSMTGVAALGASATPGGTGGGGGGGAATVHWDRCDRGVPDRARCGHIRVLADPLRPGIGRQRVGFELYRRSERSRPSLGTIVAQEGGPGYPSTETRNYYLGLFRPLMDRRDLLLVDQRGTGTSDPIRCKPLQRGATPYVHAVGECGQQLGRRSDTYATAYAVADTAAVMDALGVDQVDLYGDSYGTFFAQTFAVRYPERVRTLILDASYPISGQDPWWRDTNRAIADALTRVCQRDPSCRRLPGSAVRRMRTVAQAVHDDPVVSHAFNAAGHWRKVRLNGVNLALVTAYATYGTSIYRELDSAVRAFRHGYQRPLLRLVAENVSKSYAGGNAAYYSAGEYAAVICSDYPQLWDVSLDPGSGRRQQYRDAVDDVMTTDPTGFDPFRVDDWIRSGWTEPKTCLQWPAPTDPIPPEPANATYPSTPTLVLSGDLDTVTSPEGGVDVTSRFPNATFVSVPNSGHVTALGDKQGCVAGLVLRFVRTSGSVGDTGCVSEYAPVRVVPQFVRVSERLQPARPGTTPVPKVDRQVVSGALFAAADPLTRWYVNYSGSGVGLAGGRFSYSGGSDRVVFHLDRLAFVHDVRVSGRIVWNRDKGQVRTRLDVDGPGRHDGALDADWSDWSPHSQATVTGRISGHPIRLQTPAP